MAWALKNFEEVWVLHWTLEEDEQGLNVESKDLILTEWIRVIQTVGKFVQFPSPLPTIPKS